MARRHQGLRPFLQDIRKLLKESPREALEEFIVSLARECGPEDREAFINRLKPHRAHLPYSDDYINTVMVQLDDRIRQTREGRHIDPMQMERVGPLRQEPERNTPVKNVIEYFDEAHKLFLAGERRGARDIYQKLLSLFYLQEEYPNIVGRKAMSVFSQEGIHETCSRYFRALYDTMPLGSRAEALAEAMRTFGLLCDPPPLFQDVIDASEDPIDDLDEFLALWRRTLEERSGERHGWGWVSIWDELRAEAVILQEGADGAQKMARERGPHQAMAYLKWVEALIGERRRAEALAAAREALREIRPFSRTRAQIAELLASLAREANDDHLFQLNRREAFRSYPTLERLIYLYKEAKNEVESREEMSWAAQQLAKITLQTNDDVELEDRLQDLLLLRVRALLLAGEMVQAIDCARGGNPLGWTFGADPQGVVVPSILVAAAGAPPPSETPYLYRVLTTYPAPDEAENDFKSLFIQQVKHQPLDFPERERLFSLISPMFHARISAIMEGQKRDSYPKAAHLVLAAREAMRELARSREGNEMVEQLCRKYARASRFLREIHLAEVIPAHPNR